MMITLSEYKKFNQMVEQNPNQIFSIAIASYIVEVSSQILLQSIREEKVDDLIANLPIIENQNEKRKINCAFFIY